MSEHMRFAAHGHSSQIRRTLAALALGCWVLLVHGQEAAPLPADVAAKLRVLDLVRGAWIATLITTRPAWSVVTYTEICVCILGGRFLQGDTGVKSDGVRYTVLATYCSASGGFPFWIFSSSGARFYLSPGSWDEATC